LETTGFLLGSSEVWNHKFNLSGVSLTKPMYIITVGRITSGEELK
jgi:hypothetical protein